MPEHDMSMAGHAKIKVEKHGDLTDYVCLACNVRLHSQQEAMEHGMKHRMEHGKS
ncbi:MAG: hypothetical protein KGH64_03530 [Candidatus Micrarchaeota archaeon]|nr:hypothetical protein [Candidatus Micrarchaeota archaeon]MDE1834381.1 hypothetical protein [Candidatus Micrarchaeota archaeon]